MGRDAVAALLKQAGFSLRGNALFLACSSHPDRDAQFRHLNDEVRLFMDAGDPVISVDSKKKEQIGLFAQAGREWASPGAPVKVLDHDFPSQAVGTAIPYGIYDMGRNAGFVVVGTDHDTAAFAVAALRRWWVEEGRAAYPSEPPERRARSGVAHTFWLEPKPSSGSAPSCPTATSTPTGASTVLASTSASTPTPARRTTPSQRDQHRPSKRTAPS